MVDTTDGSKPQADEVPPKVTERQRGSMGNFLHFVTTYWRLIFTLLLLFLIAVMYQWKTIAVDNLREEMKEERTQLTAVVNQIVVDKNTELVRLAALPLSWAVRSEMVKDNYENINQYFLQLIRHNRFRSIDLANQDGKIVVATDKTHEGVMISSMYSQSVLDQYETTVKVLENGNLMAVAPVMGITGKIGILLFVYAPEKVSLKIADKS